MAQGNRPWDPWKMYDASANELRAINERAKMREALKAEWIKKSTDPWRSAHPSGHLFDPAVQRFISLKATQAEYFRGTVKSMFVAFSIFVLPIGLFTYITIKNKTAEDRRYRNGEVKYKDRENKFVY